jgi:hypothetical protein
MGTYLWFSLLGEAVTAPPGPRGGGFLPDEKQPAGMRGWNAPAVSALPIRVVAFTERERLPARPLVYIPRAGGRC